MYFETANSVITNGQTTSEPIHAGRHAFPFQIKLPSNLPTSVKLRNASIFYTAQAVLPLCNSDSIVSEKQSITIIQPNKCSETEMIQKEKTAEYSTCTRSGRVHCVLRAVKTDVVPGDSILFSTDVNNLSFRRIRGVYIIFKQLAKTGERLEKRDICRIDGPQIRAGKRVCWNHSFRISSLPPTMTFHQLNINYRLELIVDVVGSEAIKLNIKVRVGNEPRTSACYIIKSYQREFESIWLYYFLFFTSLHGTQVPRPKNFF